MSYEPVKILDFKAPLLLRVVAVLVAMAFILVAGYWIYFYMRYDVVVLRERAIARYDTWKNQYSIADKSVEQTQSPPAAKVEAPAPAVAPTADKYELIPVQSNPFKKTKNKAPAYAPEGYEWVPVERDPTAKN